MGDEGSLLGDVEPGQYFRTPARENGTWIISSVRRDPSTGVRVRQPGSDPNTKTKPARYACPDTESGGACVLGAFMGRESECQ